MHLKKLWESSSIPQSTRRDDGSRIFEALIENAAKLKYTEGPYKDESTGIRIENQIYHHETKQHPTLALVLTDLYQKNKSTDIDMVSVSTGTRVECQNHRARNNGKHCEPAGFYGRQRPFSHVI